jgi:hypothetical protein
VTTDLAVITLQRIIRRETSVLRVMHAANDGGWQFLDDQMFSTDDAAVVGLQQMFLLDPSLAELVDLAQGWCAVRADPDAPWQRAPI